MSFLIFATAVAVARASPINIFTGPTQTVPTIVCPDSLCDGKADGSYRHRDDPSYFVTCMGGNALSCKRCNFEGSLHFNEYCNQCRYPDDANSQACDYYTGVTRANDVCSYEDNAYAIWFCQNLQNVLGAGWQDKSGDFAYEVYNKNPPYALISQLRSRYISCIEGMMGYCRFCPADLVWYHLKDDLGHDKLDCGVCDYA